jgi:outer membrane protein assembly factor BamA
LFSLFTLIHQNSSAESITVTAVDFDEQIKQLECVIPEPITVAQCTYESDIFLEQQEFDYLTDLSVGKIITNTDLYYALYYLNKKSIFESIEVHSIHDTEDSINLHFILHGHAQFAKLIIKGLVVGKEAYHHYYLIQPGELFDEAKHNDSCRAIEDVFVQQGYLDGTVRSLIKHDLQTKSVTVTLYLDRHDRYTIGTATLKISACPNNYNLESLSEQLRYQFLNSLSGAWYSKEHINHETRAMHTYLSRKGFLQPTIELQEKINRATKKVDIIFTIQLQHKKSFIFCGNSFFSRKQLRDIILEFGNTACLLPVPLLAEEIEKTYHDHGFLQATVVGHEYNDQMTFTIEEGQRAFIKNVEFNGVNYGNTFKAPHHFSRLVTNRFFDAQHLKKSIDALINEYVQHGFWHAAVTKQELLPIDDTTDYRLSITVDEHQQIYVGTVSVIHFPLLETELSPISKNQPFELELIEQQKNILSSYFTKHGYERISLKPTYAQEGQYLNVTWHVDTSLSQKTFGKTVIHGCTPLRFSYLMRELTYQQGQPWRTSNVKQSLLNLRALHGFEHLSLSPDPTLLLNDQQPVILKLYKDDPFELRARGGFALRQLSKYFAFSGITYTAGGTFLYKNPLHFGDELKLNIDMSRSARVAQLQYHIPWFFKWPVRTVFQGYSNKYVQPGIVNELKHLYDVTQQGFLIGTRRIWPHVQQGCTIGIEWMKTVIKTENPHEISDVQVAKAIFFEPRLLDHNIAYVMVEPTILIDYLDNELNPHAGSLSLFSIKGMFPVSTIGIKAYLLKIMAEQSLFIPVRSCVIALRARIGHIFHEKFSTIMPIERFYLGGAHSIRSYETDAVPPLGKIIDRMGREILVPQGGKSMFSLNIEARFSIYKEFGAVIFQDFGALSTNTLLSITNKDIVAGTGFGLRYQTPLGPARLDVGFKWHVPDPLLLPYAWFVSIGHAF